MIIDVWSWDAKPGMAGEATDWAKDAAQAFNALGDARAMVVRPNNGNMMTVYLVTTAETQASLDDSWQKWFARDTVGEELQRHNEVLDQGNSRRHQYTSVGP